MSFWRWLLTWWRHDDEALRLARRARHHEIEACKRGEEW